MSNRSISIFFVIIISLSFFLACSTESLISEEQVQKSRFAQDHMVVINEIASTGKFEFIELANLMDYPIKLREGWTLDDNGAHYLEGSQAFFIPEGTIIPAKGYLLICPFVEEDATEVLNNPLIPESALLDFSFTINNVDTINLYRGIQLIDSISWDSDVNSIGRKEEQPSQITKLLKPTPGFSNICELMIDIEPPIVINEICSFGLEYIEIYNTSDEDYQFNDANWKLEDIQKNKSITILAEAVVAGKGFLVLYSIKGENFSLGSNDTLYLLRDGEIVDYLSWNRHVNSIGRFPDGGESWVYDMPKTIGSENQETLE